MIREIEGLRADDMGSKIFSLRMARGMTQEQLAEVLHVSPAAVSKWERGVVSPGIEMLWALADFFDCTIDELVGRSQRKLEQMGVYDEKKARLAKVAGDLLKCCETARQQGLLALDEAAGKLEENEPGKHCFLAFAIRFYLTSFYRQVPPEMIFELLANYAGTLPEEEQAEGRLVTTVLKLIVSGECPEIVQEVAASYVGMGYREKLDRHWTMTRDEILAEVLSKYKDKPQYSEATGLLNGFDAVGDFELQIILRNLDNDTFVKAMCGAPGKVVVRFMRNLSDRLLVVFGEDIDHWEGTEEEIVQAQRRVLEAGAFALQKSK